MPRTATMLSRLAARLPRALARSNRGVLWAREVDPGLGFEPDPPGYQLRAVAPDDAPTLAAAIGTAPAAVAERLAAGQRCFAAFAGPDLAAYCWAATAPVPVAELEGVATPGPAEAYLFECATQPAHRGRGLYPALLRQAVAELGRAGVRRCWIGADADNVASQRGIERAGFQPVAEVHFLRLLGWRRLAFRPDPKASAALVAAARRLLR